MLHAVPAQDPRNAAAVPEDSRSAGPPSGATRWAHSHWAKFIRAVPTVVGAITFLVRVDPGGWVSTVGQEETGEALGHISAQALLLIFTMGTGADAVTHPVGRDALPSVMA